MELIPPFRVNPKLDWPTVITSRHWAHDTRYLVPEQVKVLEYGEGSPVFLSVTPSTYVSIQIDWGTFIISGVKTPWSLSSPRHQNDVVHTILSVEYDKVIRNLMLWRYWHKPASRLQHPQTWCNESSSWLGGFVSIVRPFPRHWELSSPHRSTPFPTVPSSNRHQVPFFSVYLFLQARTSYHIASCRVLWPVLPQNGF